MEWSDCPTRPPGRFHFCVSWPSADLTTEHGQVGQVTAFGHALQISIPNTQAPHGTMLGEQSASRDERTASTHRVRPCFARRTSGLRRRGRWARCNRPRALSSVTHHQPTYPCAHLWGRRGHMLPCAATGAGDLRTVTRGCRSWHERARRAMRTGVAQGSGDWQMVQLVRARAGSAAGTTRPARRPVPSSAPIRTAYSDVLAARREDASTETLAPPETI